MDHRIFLLCEQLSISLNHQWTTKEMAAIVGVSIPHFLKLFKKNVGKPPMTYLIDLRLEKARELLETTFQNVTEIRLAVRMLSDSHFTRDFKKKYGLTPTKYRKRHYEKVQAEIKSAKK